MVGVGLYGRLSSGKVKEEMSLDGKSCAIAVKCLDARDETIRF
jgi:hypothetical protein